MLRLDPLTQGLCKDTTLRSNPRQLTMRNDTLSSISVGCKHLSAVYVHPLAQFRTQCVFADQMIVIEIDGDLRTLWMTRALCALQVGALPSSAWIEQQVPTFRLTLA